MTLPYITAPSYSKHPSKLPNPCFLAITKQSPISINHHVLTANLQTEASLHQNPTRNHAKPVLTFHHH
jgi:hypothetical protein